MKYKKTVIFLSVLSFAGTVWIVANALKSGTAPAETKIFVKENNPQVLTFYTNFTLCGHKTVYKAKGDRYFVNAADAESFNPDFTVDEFSEDSVVLSKTENKYCNSHFYAVLNDNMIYIYSRYSGKAEYCFPALSTRLTDEETEALKKGIDFDSKESMLSFVEDYTS